MKFRKIHNLFLALILVTTLIGCDDEECKMKVTGTPGQFITYKDADGNSKSVFIPESGSVESPCGSTQVAVDW
jgi:hypothetical protein